MKASKTLTTVAAAALVSVIGLAYAQTSDTNTEAATTQYRDYTTGDQRSAESSEAAAARDGQPAATEATVVTPEIAQPEVQAAPPVDNTNLNANGATSSAADPNAASTNLAQQPSPTPSYDSSTPAPAYTSDASLMPERAPRADRN